MSRDDRKYVRVYYDLIREFPGVYADDGALACWLRLLMVADAMWPGVPELTRSAKPRALRMLTEAGLVIVTGHTFAIRGLDAERTRRSNAGRTGAAVRWQSERTADAMPRRDETSRDETKSTPPPSQAKGRRETRTNPRALGTNPRSNGTSTRQEREKQKTGPLSIGAILKAANAAGHDA